MSTFFFERNGEKRLIASEITKGFSGQVTAHLKTRGKCVVHLPKDKPLRINGEHGAIIHESLPIHHRDTPVELFDPKTNELVERINHRIIPLFCSVNLLRSHFVPS